MTDSPRAQIALRLAYIAGTYAKNFKNRERLLEEAEQFVGMADEVLRLMEWARLVGGSNADGMAEPWLTLPPEDWKP